MHSRSNPKVVILGGSLTGNRGAEGMLLSCVQHIGAQCPEAEFTLLSVYPEDDWCENHISGLKIVDFSPVKLAGVCLPAGLLRSVIPRRLLAGRIARALSPEAVRAIAAADLWIDMSGVSFVDGRGFALLSYNALCVLIPWLFGVPVLKYSQALGPFRDTGSRMFARSFLPLVDCVIARGETTRAAVASLGFPAHRLELCADSAFAMVVDNQAKRRADAACDDDFFRDGKVIAVSPSSVVHGYCAQRGIDDIGAITAFINARIAEGRRVALIAHSVRPGRDSLKNNDVPVCEEIKKRIGPSDLLFVVPYDLHAAELRAVIGRCELLVASRFHAMISGLAMGVPTMLVGWSHKYAEVLAAFDERGAQSGTGFNMESLALNYQDLSGEKFEETFADLRARSDEIRRSLRANIDRIVASSRENADHAVRMLRQRHAGREPLKRHGDRRA